MLGRNNSISVGAGGPLFPYIFHENADIMKKKKILKETKLNAIKFAWLIANTVTRTECMYNRQSQY